METLKTPAQWEAEEGIKVANRAVYSEVGLETPITYETWRNITQTLTVMFNKDRIPKTIGLDLAVEKIEKEIAWWEELSANRFTGKIHLEHADVTYTEGVISGLKKALVALRKA